MLTPAEKRDLYINVWANMISSVALAIIVGMIVRGGKR